jgi:hypothetical protein
LYFNRTKQLLQDQNSNEENQEPSSTSVNKPNPLNTTGHEMVSLEKYKLEVEQRVDIKWKNYLIKLKFAFFLFVRNILKNCYDIVIMNFNNLKFVMKL